MKLHETLLKNHEKCHEKIAKKAQKFAKISRKKARKTRYAVYQKSEKTCWDTSRHMKCLVVSVGCGMNTCDLLQMRHSI